VNGTDDPLPPEVRAALEATPPPPAPTFPTLVLDGIGKAMLAMYDAMDEDMLAAFKAWGDLKGLKERCARIEVRDSSAPNESNTSDMFTVHGARLELGGTILIADTAHYGTAPPGQINVERHERKFAGKTYSVALLHRDEAAKIPATESEAPMPEPDQEPPSVLSFAHAADRISDNPIEPPEGADEFARLCNRLYFDLDQWTGGPLHVALEDENLGWLIGTNAENQIAEFTAALERINVGDIPTGPNREDPVADTAYYYGRYEGNRSEVLRCAIDILNVCKGWTEEQLLTAYDPWKEQAYGDNGSYHVWRQRTAGRENRETP